MQLPNFFHIGAVRGIHLTHTCANPGTIEMPAAIHTWARWALGQKLPSGPDRIHRRPGATDHRVSRFPVRRPRAGPPAPDCQSQPHPITSRLVPLIHQAFGVRLVSRLPGLQCSLPRADPEKILVEGANSAPATTVNDPRNHYALMFALRHSCAAARSGPDGSRPSASVERVHLEFACLLCITCSIHAAELPGYRRVTSARPVQTAEVVDSIRCYAEPGPTRTRIGHAAQTGRRQAETATRQVRRLSAYVAAAASPAAACHQKRVVAKFPLAASTLHIPRSSLRCYRPTEWIPVAPA